MVAVFKPEEVRNGLRPRVFACVVSGVSFNEEGLLVNFMRFQTKLHSGLGEQRKAATMCTHDYKHLTLPLLFSLQPVDVIYVSCFFACVTLVKFSLINTYNKLRKKLKCFLGNDKVIVAGDCLVVEQI